ncbi:MAG: MiaB/RimO family radical SAM methylthiotransferase [Candidatus Omnitrophica bacterium]|nr:MiaB/RimO family radical SAM methylthiotransferase [Candidatus Omnitrophota bacterium]
MAQKFSLISLGCFRNTYDSELIAQRFMNKGYRLIGSSLEGSSQAVGDLLIINTCGFIDAAKEESIAAIKEAVRLKKIGKARAILVCGCLVQRYRKTLEKFFPEVDSWQGIESLDSGFASQKTLTPSFSSFLKICEGCANHCSYCAIPLIKGPLKSRSREDILKEARFLDKHGTVELNIIGQDITSWGSDLGETQNLASLLKDILRTTKNIRWIRLIYTHPAHISRKLIDVIANNERICKYIDVPIQHISDRILKNMNRRITKKEIISLIKFLRKKIPGCCLRTSVIVGYPCETEQEFKELLNFLKEVKFERLGVFLYSREEGTPAYSFRPQVHYRTKKRRLQEIMNLQQEISSKACQRMVGSKLEVLVEEKQKNVYTGRTQYDAPEVDGVVFLKKKGLNIGQFYEATITDAYEYDLVGK